MYWRSEERKAPFSSSLTPSLLGLTDLIISALADSMIFWFDLRLIMFASAEAAFCLISWIAFRLGCIAMSTCWSSEVFTMSLTMFPELSRNSCYRSRISFFSFAETRLLLLISLTALFCRRFFGFEWRKFPCLSNTNLQYSSLKSSYSSWERGDFFYSKRSSNAYSAALAATRRLLREAASY